MFSLPKNTILGYLQIEAIFQFYDIPRLFICSNNAGNKFLALSIFDDYDSFKWIYLPLSKDRLSTLINQAITLRQAFLEPEDNYVYLITSDFHGKADVTYLFPEQIEEDNLPQSEVYLKTNKKINIGLGSTDANIAAKSSKRETYNIHFYPWDTQLPEIDAKNLGLVLTSFQDLADALGQFCTGETTLKGAIPVDITEAAKFRATQIFDGSFGIQLKSKAISDLFYNSLASDILLELTNLLETKDDEDSISNKLHKLKGRVASKYRIFLREVSKLDSPMKLHWGSPNQERGSIVLLTKQEIKKAFELVSKIDIDMSESVTFKSELLGLDVKTKRYRVRHLADNEDYSGKIADESLTKVEHSEINGIYNVTLKKVIETNFSSGLEYTKWILINLLPSSP